MELTAVPAGETSVIGPVEASGGTTVVIVVSDWIVNWAAAPVKLAEVTPARFAPVITAVPATLLVGVNDVRVGVGVGVGVVVVVVVVVVVAVGHEDGVFVADT